MGPHSLLITLLGAIFSELIRPPPAVLPRYGPQPRPRGWRDQAALFAPDWRARCQVPTWAVPMVLEAARAAGVPPALVAAVARTESAWEPRALSPVGAQGLMQLMPATARQLGVQDPFDPRACLAGGARYLRQLLDTFNDVRLGVAAYNAGSGNVRKHGGVPPFAETQAYVQKVLGLLV